MAAKDTDDRKTEEQEPELTLDMSQAAVKKMIAEAKERGYLTYDQLNQVLPPDQVSSEQIEDVMSMLSEMGINIIEAEEAEEEEKGSTQVAETSTSREVAVAQTETEKLDRTDDPVRMYLREMGSVELLSREGEIAIAKRIEAGRNTMISGLCESPLTFQAITIWRDELLNEDILLRDVIDLDATFGRTMDEEGEEDEPVVENLNVSSNPSKKKDDQPELDADGNPIKRDEDEDEDAVPGIRVEVADTVGAGDSLMAGVLTTLAEHGNLAPGKLAALDGDALDNMLRFGAVVAGMNCAQKGCNPPNRGEVNAVLATAFDLKLTGN